MNLASMFGEVHVLTPDTPIMDLDLLILPGGEDVKPEAYDQKPGYMAGNNNPMLEEFDAMKLSAYIDKHTPIFGICRGLQTLNVNFGGTICQHIYKHPTNSREDGGELVHKVTGKGIKTFEVNSRHHQAIGLLGRGLEAILYCKEDRYIESIKHKELPIIAVQWHPEDILDEYSMNAIKSLLNI
jgi:putative glutamine amidotransferase